LGKKQIFSTLYSGNLKGFLKGVTKGVVAKGFRGEKRMVKRKTGCRKPTKIYAKKGLSTFGPASDGMQGRCQEEENSTQLGGKALNTKGA